MAPPILNKEEILRRVAVLQDCHRNLSLAAQRLCLSRAALQGSMYRGESRGWIKRSDWHRGEAPPSGGGNSAADAVLERLPPDGATLADLAAAAGLTRGQALDALEALEAAAAVARDGDLYYAVGAPPREVSPAEDRLPTTERQRLQDQITALRQEKVALTREANAQDDFRVAILGLSRETAGPATWDPADIPTGTPGMPVLFTSDFQWGETIKADEVQGINAYDAEIARERYRLLISKTIHLACNQLANAQYPGIVYLRGGDAISGDIHDELRETNDLQSIPAVMDLVAEEARGISLLADRFGRVEVYSVPGNHGRTTKKPHAKAYAHLNYETLIAWFLEREFQARGDTRVSFVTPLSGDVLFRVYNTSFLLTHGDRIGSRGGQGFIGPVATVARGVQKVRQQYAQSGHHIDYVLMGHFHEAFKLRHSINNGTLAGFSEYAFGQLRVTPAPPSQTLFFVHPTVGLTSYWEIYLDDPATPSPVRPAVAAEATA